MTVNLRTRAELIDLLSRSLGAEAAAAHVHRAAAALQVGAEMSVNDALNVLETLAAEPGLPGIAARFTKARVLMTWQR